MKFRIPVICQSGHKAYWYNRVNELGELRTITIHPQCYCPKEDIGLGYRQNGEIELWSGMLDVNGVEVYAGDRLLDVENVSGHVVFKDGAFWVDYGKRGTYLLKDRLVDYQAKVITE